jgi:hypothetical protein
MSHDCWQSNETPVIAKKETNVMVKIVTFGIWLLRAKHQSFCFVLCISSAHPSSLLALAYGILAGLGRMDRSGSNDRLGVSLSLLALLSLHFYSATSTIFLTISLA